MPLHFTCRCVIVIAVLNCTPCYLDTDTEGQHRRFQNSLVHIHFQNTYLLALSGSQGQLSNLLLALLPFIKRDRGHRGWTGRAPLLALTEPPTYPGDNRHDPATLRSRGPILEILKTILPSDFNGNVLEIASGTGCHAEYISRAFPKSHWQPSEFKDRLVQEMNLGGFLGMTNIAPAVKLDASTDWSVWPSAVREKEGNFEMVFISNLMHVSPWNASCGAIAGAGRALISGGKLIVHGPFKVNGEFPAESTLNCVFDGCFRNMNPEWGYRDLSEVQAEANKHGFTMQGCQPLPSTCLLMHFVKL